MPSSAACLTHACGFDGSGQTNLDPAPGNQTAFDMESGINALFALTQHFSNLEALVASEVMRGWSFNQPEPWPCKGSRSLWTGVLCSHHSIIGLNFTDLPLNGPIPA